MPTQIQQVNELKGKLDDRRQKLQTAFDEAKSKDNDGAEIYDLSRVKSFGEGLTAGAVAEQIRKVNDELNDLGAEYEELSKAQGAADSLSRGSGMRHPGAASDGDAKDRAEMVQSLGERVAGSKRYQEWAKSGAAGGLTFQEDALPSDILAKAAEASTLQAKTLFQTSGGWAPESLRIGGYVEAVTRPIQLLDIIPLAQTGYEQIVYMEETTRTHAAAETAEGGAYPEAAFALTEKTSPVRKIATSIPVTDEQLEDVAQAESYLNTRLTFGLRQRLDNQVQAGGGIGSDLTGLANVTGINTQAKGTDPIPDAVFKAGRQVRVTGRAMPTHVVMHAEDWEKVRLLRTADGQYIWGNPSEAGPERIWGWTVVQSEVESAGTAYVGSFQPQWLSLFERRGVDVQVGYVGSQFTEGKRTIRGDMRTAFVVFRPAAFTQVTGL